MWLLNGRCVAFFKPRKHLLCELRWWGGTWADDGLSHFLHCPGPFSDKHALRETNWHADLGAIEGGYWNMEVCSIFFFFFFWDCKHIPWVMKLLKVPKIETLIFFWLFFPHSSVFLISLLVTSDKDKWKCKNRPGVSEEKQFSLRPTLGPLLQSLLKISS